MLNKIRKINEALKIKFPQGNDPFQIVTRLLEECGEVANQVNHFENAGVKKIKNGEPNKANFAKEIQDVLRCLMQLSSYYDLDEELKKSINTSLLKIKESSANNFLTND